MSNYLINLLDKLYTQLELVKSPLLTLLSDGINREEMNNILREVDVHLPEEVYTLYEWRNGTSRLHEKAMGEIELFSMGIFYPPEDVLEEYNRYMGEDEYWGKGMIPIFGGNGGDYYLLDCAESSPSQGKIHYYSYYGLMDLCGKPIITYYDSLESLIKTTIECYQQKAYYYDPSDPMMLEIDYDLEKKIAKKYNPAAEYWKLV